MNSILFVFPLTVGMSGVVSFSTVSSRMGKAIFGVPTDTDKITIESTKEIMNIDSQGRVGSTTFMNGPGKVL